MKKLSTATEVIEKLGGRQSVADMFGVSYNAVGNWVQDGQFPSHTYRGMIEALVHSGAMADVSLWKFKALATEVARSARTEAAQ